jgi:hypothetical protein
VTAFATFNGARVVSGSIAIPLYGMWSGDVSLSDDGAVNTTGPLVLGNLTLQGAIYRQAAFGGRRALRLIAGAGGWHKIVPKRQYYLAAPGVLLSTILNDAAMEVGETIGRLTDGIVGTGFARIEGPAAYVLRSLAGSSWYIDPAGVTQIEAWPTKPVQTEFTVVEQDGGQGRITIATEDYAAWMPGTTFAGPTLAGTYTSGGVRYVFAEDGTFRLEVLTQ